MKLPGNLDIRAVSILLAAILWMHAVTEREFTVDYVCPVAVANVPSDMVLSSPMAPATCRITARGKDLLALKIKGPRVVVDAGNRRIRNLVSRLSASHLVLPFAMEDLRVEFQPSELAVRMDRLGEGRAAVAVDLAGQPAEGYIVSDSTFAEPCSVMIRGAERQVLQMDTVYTEPVRVDELKDPRRIRVRLAVPEAQLYRADPESVWVNLVFERTGERLFRNVPLSLANRGSGYLVSFSPGTVDILAAGPRQPLERALPSDIKVVLDLKGLTPGSHQLQAVIELPDRLELIAATPRTFEVTIR